MIRCGVICLKKSIITHCKTDVIVASARFLSSIEHKIKSHEKGHPFANLCPWKSKQQLAEFLVKNTILCENGLIVLNKPYGLGIQQPLKSREGRMTLAIPNAENYCLTDVLPLLGNAFGVERLIIVKSTEKYSSGITLLATSEKVVEKIKKCRRRDLASMRLTSKYLAVVVGQPSVSSKHETVNYLLIKSPDGKSKQPLVQDSKSKQLKSEEEIKARVEHNTVGYSDFGACLVDIKPSITKWHFLRVYLTHLLSPVLGDNLYGSRVQSCMGVTMTVNPFNVLCPKQKVNQGILDALDVPPEGEPFIPCHLHLQEVILSSFNKDKTDLTIVAPPPAFFEWTCDKLHLQIKM